MRGSRAGAKDFGLWIPAFAGMTSRTQEMNKDVLEAWLDLTPSQGIVAKIGDRPLERYPVAAGDMDRAPEYRSRFDAGHLPQPARGLVDGLSVAS